MAWDPPRWVLWWRLRTSTVGGRVRISISRVASEALPLLGVPVRAVAGPDRHHGVPVPEPVLAGVEREDPVELELAPSRRAGRQILLQEDRAAGALLDPDLDAPEAHPRVLGSRIRTSAFRPIARGASGKLRTGGSDS